MKLLHYINPSSGKEYIILTEEKSESKDGRYTENARPGFALCGEPYEVSGKNGTPLPIDQILISDE
jgi:hypothetical protein